MKHRIALFAVALGAGAAVLAPASAAALSWGWGREVVMISPHASEAVELNRALWTRGEPVAPVYGIPSAGPVRVVFAEAGRVIVPAEDPGLTLYTVDKQGGENPLQAQTLWFFARLVSVAGAGLALMAVLGWLWRRRSSG
ncbi:MAG: hypothetical protein HYY93_05190 [Planctomycetes bacterium]|nr:hypothetical protein [Planctomycetota bacterium]